ncbi:expressed unknown protein [Seminavis robusta]|uniref:Uncharacterized protein n=1 Tax=Seminavis robusta TaxID=568900 RepID=A0A9N8HEZ4_9STRA|nr:expressed unknown protein [Seminavis robusta]|eukprot:Sro499_g155010.1 n/a (96) ;mRNA; r:18737-19102
MLDFMNIPGRRLPELHALALEYYKPLKSHNSWACVHYHFITSSFCHIGNRMVRTLETFRKSRVRFAPGSGKLPTGRGLLSPKIMEPVPTESTKMD